jgi:hypothetical protein
MNGDQTIMNSVLSKPAKMYLKKQDKLIYKQNFYGHSNSPLNKSMSKVDTSCPKSFKNKKESVIDALISQTILNEDLTPE